MAQSVTQPCDLKNPKQQGDSWNTGFPDDVGFAD